MSSRSNVAGPERLPVEIDSQLVAEQAAAAWLQHWGDVEAATQSSGSSAFVQIRTSQSLAMVRWGGAAVDVADLVMLTLEVPAGPRLFAFTDRACAADVVDFAEQRGIVLLLLSGDGQIEALNIAAVPWVPEVVPIAERVPTAGLVEASVVEPPANPEPARVPELVSTTEPPSTTQAVSVPVPAPRPGLTPESIFPEVPRTGYTPGFAAAPRDEDESEATRARGWFRRRPAPTVVDVPTVADAPAGLVGTGMARPTQRPFQLKRTLEARAALLDRDLPAADEIPELAEVLAQGDRMAAVRAYRGLVGVGLRDATDAIDALGLEF